MTAQMVKEIQSLEADLGMKISKETDLANMSPKAVESYLSYLRDNKKTDQKRKK